MGSSLGKASRINLLSQQQARQNDIVDFFCTFEGHIKCPMQTKQGAIKEKDFIVYEYLKCELLKSCEISEGEIKVPKNNGFTNGRNNLKSCLYDGHEDKLLA